MLSGKRDYRRGPKGPDGEYLDALYSLHMRLPLRWSLMMPNNERKFVAGSIQTTFAVYLFCVKT